MNNTKDVILNEAFKLFLQRSYKEVSIQDIAAKVGVTKGAFYYFFKSKEEIFREVFNHFYLSGFKINYDKLSDDSLYEFYHNINKYSSDSVLFFNQNDDDVNNDSNINIYAFMANSLNLFPDLTVGIKEAQLTEFNAWKQIIYNARNKGEIKSILSDEQIANIFIYTSDGIAMNYSLHGKVQDCLKQVLIMWDDIYATLKT